MGSAHNMNNIASIIRKSAFPVINRHAVSETSVAQNYSALLDAVGDAEIVMIGEASHGTHDFYHQRAEITKQLILKKNFTFIAIEGDWPDAYRVNRYVQHGKRKDNTAAEALGDFKRFPLWMWRNRVIMDFVEWLRGHNDQFNDAHKKVAFYGMDLYSFYSSMDAVIEYLEKVSPEDAKVARRRYSNFDRFQGEPHAYGQAAGFGLSGAYEKEVLSTLLDLKKKEEDYLKGVGGLIDGDELFYTQQNAELVKNAEEYYRKMYQADERTWNLRDKHMVDCVTSLFNYHKKKFKGERQEKVVIWAHNSHLGDARQTDASLRGEWNVGQLMRERFGLTKTFNIGFSTYTGTVTAAKSWDKPAQCMKVRNGLTESYEHVLHSATENWEYKDYYMLFRSNTPNVKVNPELVDALLPPRYERYIGVIYRPDTEKASHYCKSSLPKEYDSVIFLDQTRAVEPIDPTKPWEDQHKLLVETPVDPDTYPELEQFSFTADDKLEYRLQAGRDISQVGLELMKKGDYVNAIHKFDKALQYVEYNLKKHQGKREVQELRLKIMIDRADAYYNLKLWSGVIRDCSTIINLDPSHFQAHLLLGKAYDEKGQDSIAKHHYEIAAKGASQEWQTVNYAQTRR